MMVLVVHPNGVPTVLKPYSVQRLETAGENPTRYLLQLYVPVVCLLTNMSFPILRR